MRRAAAFVGLLLACGGDPAQAPSRGAGGAADQAAVTAGAGGGTATAGSSAGAAGGSAGASSASSSLCAKVCERSDAAKCDNAFADCRGACEARIGVTASDCRDELDAYLTCAAGAKFSCNAYGEPVADACKAQADAAAGCTPKAGDPGDPRDSPSCKLKSSDSCTACLQDKCCGVYAACMALEGCRVSWACGGATCTSDECNTGCINQSRTGGGDQYLALMKCRETCVSAGCPKSTE